MSHDSEDDDTSLPPPGPHGVIPVVELNTDSPRFIYMHEDFVDPPTSDQLDVYGELCWQFIQVIKVKKNAWRAYFMRVDESSEEPS